MKAAGSWRATMEREGGLDRLSLKNGARISVKSKIVAENAF